MATDDEEMVQVVAEVPESVRDTAKDKLDYGGLSREIRDCLEEVAFGPTNSQRSRLERRRDELKSELRDLRERRRDVEAEIETVEDRIDAIEEKLSSISSAEERYEAKLEEVEQRLRADGIRILPGSKPVQRTASAGAVEPERVIKDLKERNPDVPDFAFEDALHDDRSWTGVADDEVDLPVDERDEKYR